MRPVQVKQIDYHMAPTAGFVLDEHDLKTLRPVRDEVDVALTLRTGVASSDILRSYLGLLVQNKSDFDAIESLCADKFFMQSPGIGMLPSSPTLRQRMDAGSVPLGAPVPARRPPLPSPRPNRSFDLKLTAYRAKRPSLQVAI